MLTMEAVVEGESVPFDVFLPVSFPYGEIEVCLKDASWFRFEHQSSNGKLCLPADGSGDRGPERLAQVVKTAVGWIQDALAGTLAIQGARFELPDFPTDPRLRDPEYTSRVVFDDEPAEVGRWRRRIGEAGPFELVKIEGGWAIRSMADMMGTPIARATTVRIPPSARCVRGRWILADRFSPTGHRAPRTWGELRQVFPLVDRECRLAWESSQDGAACLLVGFTIPSVIGGDYAHVHWQPIFFPSREHCRKAVKRERNTAGKRVKRSMLVSGSLWRRFETEAFPEDRIPWGYAEDVSAERLYARSRTSRTAFGSPLLIGCGALGSVIADCWVRSGLRRLGPCISRWSGVESV